MEFLADIRGVKLAPTKTVITLEVAPENTGDINGLQLLMSQVVNVAITPVQTAFEFVERADG
jgi:hypothetical protein